MAKRSYYEKLDERSKGEVDRAQKLFELFQTEAGKDQLYELLRKERYLKWLGVNSVKDIIEQVHLEKRRKVYFNRGVEYDEEAATTHFICPRGFDHHITNEGTMPNSDVPRYGCKECGTTYSGLYGSILYHRGFDLAKWYQFIDYNVANISPAEVTAEKCEIDVNTVSEWRHCLFYAVELLQAGTRLSGNIEADETYVRTNYSGKNRIETLGVQRKAHKRGKATRQKDIHKDLVSIICAIDERGNCIARVAGIGEPTALRLSSAIGDAIPFGNVGYFVTDGGKALARFAEMYHLDHLALKNRHVDGSHYRPGITWIDDTMYSEQHINSMHYHLKEYLHNFKGVPTRYLQGYLNLFTYRYSRGSALFSPSAYLDILKMLVTPGHYLSQKELEEKYSTLVYVDKKNAKLAEFAPEEIEIFARFYRGETSESICERLGCSYEDFEEAILAIGEDEHVSNLAVAWFEREEKNIVLEQNRKRRQESKRERTQHILALYRSGLTMREIAIIYNVSGTRIWQIIKEAKDNGEDVSMHRGGHKAKKKKRSKKRKIKRISKRERLYNMAMELKKKYPNKNFSEIAELIIEQEGPSVGNLNTVTSAISQGRRRRNEASKHRYTPKQTWDKVVVSYNDLRKGGSNQQDAITKLAMKYKIKRGTIYAYLQRNGLLDKRDIIPTDVIIAELYKIHESKEAANISLTQACEIIGNKLDTTMNTIYARVYRYFKRIGQPVPEFQQTFIRYQTTHKLYGNDKAERDDQIINDYLAEMRERHLNPHSHYDISQRLAEKYKMGIGNIRKILGPYRKMLIEEWDAATAE